MPERQYPARVFVENTLRVWAISRWRGPLDLAKFFLKACYQHLPPGTPPMFRIEEIHMGVSGLKATFTNPYDAYHLLGKVFFCGCEFIAFMMCNIFTDFESIFPASGHMHSLPYLFPDEDQE